MDKQALDRIAQDVAKVDFHDHILAWDKKQSGFPAHPEARWCANDRAHGRLQMHGDGSRLICGNTFPRPCDYMEPVSR